MSGRQAQPANLTERVEMGLMIENDDVRLVLNILASLHFKVDTGQRPNEAHTRAQNPVPKVMKRAYVQLRSTDRKSYRTNSEPTRSNCSLVTLFQYVARDAYPTLAK